MVRRLKAAARLISQNLSHCNSRVRMGNSRQILRWLHKRNFNISACREILSQEKVRTTLIVFTWISSTEARSSLSIADLQHPLWLANGPIRRLPKRRPMPAPYFSRAADGGKQAMLPAIL